MHAPTSTIAAYVALVTPEKASQWLRNNPNNRRKSKAGIRKLAQVIVNDEWKLNGESIIIDSTGRLLDGQHRLEAVMIAKKPVYCVVVEGVDPEAFDSIDQGRKRTNGDVFEIMGEADGGMLSAACAWVYRYQHGYMYNQVRLTPQQAANVLDVHSGLRESIPMGRLVGKTRLCPPSVATALHYLFSKVDREFAQEFMSRLADGAGLDEDSPILRLRKLLSNNQMATAKLPAPYVAGMIIRAWNRWMNGQYRKGIAMKQGDSFPRIEGIE